MWNRFCPMINGVCTDGQTRGSQLLCCHWDSLNTECLLVTQGLLSVTYHRRVLARMDEMEQLAQEILENHESMAAELEENLPKAEEFGRSKITKREDCEAHKT